MSQARLFDLPPVSQARKPTGTFLERNVLFFRAFSSSETLRRVASEAVEGNHRRHGSDRNAAAPFEDRFKQLLMEPESLAAVNTETVRAASELGLTVSDIQIESGLDKTLADIVVGYTAVDGQKVRIATNIKRLLPEATHTEGGSILSFLRLALDEEYDPGIPPTTRGFAWEQTIVEWLAGRKKIQPGRDYFLLIVQARKGKFHGVEAWPVIAGMSGGRPSAYRHTNRAVLEVAKPTSTIERGFDVNTALASALLPAANPGAARSLLAALAIAMAKGEGASEIAEKLLSLSDWEIGGVAETITS